MAADGMRRWDGRVRPLPHTLWTQAEAEHPDDAEARPRRYHDLMVEAGHIVKAEPGEDRNLPCGWPGLPPAPVMVSCGTEGCDFCPAPVLPENADKGWPCKRTGKPMARVQ